MLGQLTGEEQAHSGLNLPRSDGGTLVVVSQARGLSGNALKDIIDEGVHDPHGLGGDTGVRVDLLQDLVHVDGIALLSGLSAFLATFGCSLGDGLLGALFGRGFRRRIRHGQLCVQQRTAE